MCIASDRFDNNHSRSQIKSLPSEWQPSLPSLYLLSESGQNLLIHARMYMSLSANMLTRMKKKPKPKKKASMKYSILVSSIMREYSTYCSVKLMRHTYRNSFMPSHAQQWMRIQRRSKGSQQTAKQMKIICTDDMAMMALLGSSYSVVIMMASRIFLMLAKNQKYLVTVLQLVRIRYRAAVYVQSLIHSGFIVSSRTLRANSTKTTSSRARNKAEKKAPVAANPLLNVRLPIWVKMLMLISMRDRQKKMMKKLSHTKLYSLFTHRYTHPVLVSISALFGLSCLTASALFGSVYREFYMSRWLAFRDFSSLVRSLSLLRMRRSRKAQARNTMKTMSHVNWLAKKLAVLQRSLYLPKIF